MKLSFSIKNGIFFAAILFFSASLTNAFTIAEKGVPNVTIVVKQSALNPAKEDAVAQKINVAAHDFQDYVKKMSGAELNIVGDDVSPSGPLVLIGPSRLTDAMKIEIPSGLTPNRKEEGFLIQSKGDRLVLAGNDAGPYHGTEYATYELLNRLGVSWFAPGEFGEVIPKLSTIAVEDMAVKERPDFRQRDWWSNTTPEMFVLERRWKIRNKMNPERMFTIPKDGSVVDFMVPPEQAKEHPELFAKNSDGTLNTTMPNLSNPETVRIAADKAIEYLRAHPETGSVGMAPVDGMPRDFNPETMKINQGFSDLVAREGVPSEMSATEEWIEWINAVTKEVNKVFPDAIITTNGYANRNMAPFGVKIDPHVSIMFAAIWSDLLHSCDDPKSWQMGRQAQLLQQWTKLCDKVWIYAFDYWLVSALTPVPATHKLARDFPLYKKWGIVGFLNQTCSAWMERGIATRYLQAHLMWNANTDVKKLLADFYTRWYGAAAVPSHAFWETLEDAAENTIILGHEDRILPFVYTPELMRKLEKNIAEAEHLAATPNEKLHVQIDRLIFDHLKAYVAMSEADLKADYAEAARQGLRMMELRPKLHAIYSFLTLPVEKNARGGYDVSSGIYYWGVSDRITYYQKLADKISGKTGTLVALLPEQAAFALDPKDEGRFDGWWNVDWNTKDWNRVTTAQPFYLQGPKEQPYMDKTGYPYMGMLWYQFRVNVPAATQGKTVRLFIPVIETEAWVWVNGQYIGHRGYIESYVRPNDMDVDITSALKAGAENIITVRISTSQNRSAVSGGLISRSFLYSPIGEQGMTSTSPVGALYAPVEAKSK